MKISTTGFLLTIIPMISVFGQPWEPVAEVIKAERAFASASMRDGARTAFLKFLAADGIVFEGGQPTNGQELWKSRPDNQTLLFWWPVQAGVALSNDLGYTTGPYYVSSDRQGKDRVAFGYYSTVWKKNGNGEWKVAIDLGVSLPSFDSTSLDVAVLKSFNRSFEGATVNELLDRDEEYTDKLNAQKRSYLKTYFAKDSRIHRNGAGPFVGAASFKQIAETANYLFEPVDGEVAATGDLGYTYGNVSVRKAAMAPQQLNYLRVWRKDKYGNWMIVLDVIGG